MTVLVKDGSHTIHNVQIGKIWVENTRLSKNRGERFDLVEAIRTSSTEQLRLKLVLLLGRPGAFSSLGRWRRPTGVQLADDGLHLALQVLLALLQFVHGGVLVGVEPGDGGIHGRFNGGLVVVGQFAAQLFFVANLENVVL